MGDESQFAERRRMVIGGISSCLFSLVRVQSCGRRKSRVNEDVLVSLIGGDMSQGKRDRRRAASSRRHSTEQRWRIKSRQRQNASPRRRPCAECTTERSSSQKAPLPNG